MKIAVVMGGISSEREVSLNSGNEIINNLNKDKYEVIPVLFDSPKDLIDKLTNIDFVFIALHGKFGEDGTLQGLLESMNIPYSGCGVLSSALCMNKHLTKKLLRAEGLPTAPWVISKHGEDIDYEAVRNMGYPVFVKPNCGGSSVSTFLIKEESELHSAVEDALKIDNIAIIESFVSGEECTSFILNGEVFPTLLIKPLQGQFFDYKAKYSQNGALEEVVTLPEELQNKIDSISRQCWDLFHCSVYVRIDIIIKEGVPYILELNTLPGMTKTSLIPRSAQAKGLEFHELLDKIIEYSIIAR